MTKASDVLPEASLWKADTWAQFSLYFLKTSYNNGIARDIPLPQFCLFPIFFIPTVDFELQIFNLMMILNFLILFTLQDCLFGNYNSYIAWTTASAQ